MIPSLSRQDDSSQTPHAAHVDEVRASESCASQGNWQTGWLPGESRRSGVRGIEDFVEVETVPTHAAFLPRAHQ